MDGPGLDFFAFFIESQGEFPLAPFDIGDEDLAFLDGDARAGHRVGKRRGNPFRDGTVEMESDVREDARTIFARTIIDLEIGESERPDVDRLGNG